MQSDRNELDALTYKLYAQEHRLAVAIKRWLIDARGLPKDSPQRLGARAGLLSCLLWRLPVSVIVAGGGIATVGALVWQTWLLHQQVHDSRMIAYESTRFESLATIYDLHAEAPRRQAAVRLLLSLTPDGVTPDFRDANLRNLRFHNISFKGADMSGANLAGSTLISVDLASSTLDRAILDDTTIIACDMSSATGNHIKLGFVRIEDAAYAGGVFSSEDIWHAQIDVLQSYAMIAARDGAIIELERDESSQSYAILQNGTTLAVSTFDQQLMFYLVNLALITAGGERLDEQHAIHLGVDLGKYITDDGRYLASLPAGANTGELQTVWSRLLWQYNVEDSQWELIGNLPTTLPARP